MKKYPAGIISLIGIVVFIIGLAFQNSYPYLCIILSLIGVVTFIFGLITRDINYDKNIGISSYFKIAGKKFLFAVVIVIIVLIIISVVGVAGL